MNQVLQGAPPTGALFQQGVQVWDDPTPVGTRPRDSAGAPKPATVGKAFTSQQFDPFSLGYEETDQQQPKEEAPTLSVTICFPYAGARRKVWVPWHRGMTVQQVWHAARHKEPLFRHIGVGKYSKHIGGRKVRLTTGVSAGSTIMLEAGGYVGR